MRVSFLTLTSFIGSAIAQSTTSSSPTTEYTLTAGNITAKFIGHGARITSLVVPDRDGNVQDVVVGYDNTTQYPQDTATNHTYFGAIVGRYANRIKNGTFTIDGQTSQIPENDHGGLDTLHGGFVGYDARNWTVVASNDTSITFSLLDTGFEGFPGTVYTLVTYAVSTSASGPQGESRPRFTATIVSSALDSVTPIMLSTHIYWNFNAFKQSTILNDTTLWMPYSDRYIQTDGILIPNGTLGVTSDVPALDFTSPSLVGNNVAVAQDICGTNCTGVDNAFILDRPPMSGDTSTGYPVLSVWSNTTGIQMDLSTNQRGMQVYTCNGQNGTIPVKQSQQQRNQNDANATGFVNYHGCIVFEPQVYIDAINNPQWGVNQYEIFSPETGPFVHYSTYDFSTF